MQKGRNKSPILERLVRHCQLRRSWYARCVGGAAARVGRSFARLLCCPAPTERAAKTGGRRKAIASTPELANSFSNPFGQQPLGFESFPVGFSCMHRRISTFRMVAELGSRET